MSCKIPLSESINIYNHEFEKIDDDLVPVYDTSNKLLIIPSPGNASPGPEFHLGCGNSLNDDEDCFCKIKRVSFSSN